MFASIERVFQADDILLSELSTRDYWRAKDLIRGEPDSEQERLERAKELLERERSSSLSVGLLDLVSDSGQNADEAWREYQVAYNQAYEDGKVSEEEQTRLRDAEDYSKYTTLKSKQQTTAAKTMDLVLALERRAEMN